MLISILFYIIDYISVFQCFNSFCLLMIANIFYLYSIYCLQTRGFKISLNASCCRQLVRTPFLSFYIKYSFEIRGSLLNVIFEIFSGLRLYTRSKAISKCSIYIWYLNTLSFRSLTILFIYTSTVSLIYFLYCIRRIFINVLIRIFFKLLLLFFFFVSLMFLYDLTFFSQFYIVVASSSLFLILYYSLAFLR